MQVDIWFLEQAVPRFSDVRMVPEAGDRETAYLTRRSGGHKTRPGAKMQARRVAWPAHLWRNSRTGILGRLSPAVLPSKHGVAAVGSPLNKVWEVFLGSSAGGVSWSWRLQLVIVPYNTARKRRTGIPTTQLCGTPLAPRRQPFRNRSRTILQSLS
jgi:hypothetical protein